MVLWNAAVLRMPPFHQPSYGPPDRIVAPGLPSAASRVCSASADRLDAEDEQRILVVVERIAQRRRPEDRARPARSGGGCRESAGYHSRYSTRFMFSVSGCVEAKKSRLLSWPMYFWYSRGNAAVDRCFGSDVAHVPVGDEIVAVRIGVDEEDDHVVEDPHRLVVGAADHLVDHLAELLRAERLGGVQAAVDPDDRLAFARERARLVVGQPFGQRQAPRDVLVPREVLVVLRRRHDRHQLLAALGGLADRLERSSGPTRCRASASRRRSACSWRGSSRRRSCGRTPAAAS